MKQLVNIVEPVVQKVPRSNAGNRMPLELACWLIALFCLIWMDPTANQASLCLSKLTGLGECWGCGIGRSMAFLFEGAIEQSWQAHKLAFRLLL